MQTSPHRFFVYFAFAFVGILAISGLRSAYADTKYSGYLMPNTSYNTPSTDTAPTSSASVTTTKTTSSASGYDSTSNSQSGYPSSSGGGTTYSTSGDTSSQSSDSGTQTLTTVVTQVASQIVQPNDSAPRVLATTTSSQTTQGEQGSQGGNSGQGMPPAPPPQLEDVGSSVQQVQQATNNVEGKVNTVVTQEVNDAIQTAVSTSASSSSKGTSGSTDQEKQVQAIQSAIAPQQQQISQEVHAAITSGNVSGDALSQLQPAVQTSLDNISDVIKAQTGVTVDLSPTSNSVVSVVADNGQQLTNSYNALISRDGLDLYKDSDNDGVSDYDEVHIYHTDPMNAHTAGGPMTDGQRILLGLDPHSTSTTPVPVESPQVAGKEVKTIFAVSDIKVERHEATTTTSLPVAREEVTFSGRGLPNSFVTLYIFSTPVVVTVKTDISGAWTYTLTSELENGDHNMYVATVDAAGKIIAKSPEVPFVKTAEAATFTPLEPEITVAEPSPLDILMNNLLAVGLFLLAIFGLGAFLILSREQKPPAPPAAPTLTA